MTHSLKNRGGVLPILAFATLGIVWGSNFIYMKMATEIISPAQVTYLRVLFGFLPVAIYASCTGQLDKAHFSHILHFFVMSILACSLYFYAFIKGTSLLLSGVAGALSGSIPIFSFLLATGFIPEEKVTRIRIVGVLAGFIGVFLIASPSGEELLSPNIEGIFYMAIGSLSVGASFVYARRYIVPLAIPPVALATYQLGLGLLVLGIVSDTSGMGAIAGDFHVFIGLIIGLGLLGTGGAYIIYYYIVEKLGALTASSVTFVPPLVALAIGAVIVGEPLAVKDYFAALLILVGVVLLKKG